MRKPVPAWQWLLKAVTLELTLLLADSSWGLTCQCLQPQQVVLLFILVIVALKTLLSLFSPYVTSVDLPCTPKALSSPKGCHNSEEHATQHLQISWHIYTVPPLFFSCTEIRLLPILWAESSAGWSLSKPLTGSEASK